eukprot:2121647-Prymnesium_polylepis.1
MPLRAPEWPAPSMPASVVADYFSDARASPGEQAHARAACACATRAMDFAWRPSRKPTAASSCELPRQQLVALRTRRLAATLRGRLLLMTHRSHTRLTGVNVRGLGVYAQSRATLRQARGAARDRAPGAAAGVCRRPQAYRLPAASARRSL